jgi:hypothetical protein
MADTPPKPEKEYPEGKGSYAQRKRVTASWQNSNDAARRAMGLPPKAKPPEPKDDD